MNKKPIWIDCDPGVDDAMALLLAHRLEELNVVGISTVSGNVGLKTDTKNALGLAELFGMGCPIHAGADKPYLRPYEEGESFHGPDGLGGAALPDTAKRAEAAPAWDAVYAAAKKWRGELELIAVGPLTNVAIALSKYPDVPAYLKDIVIMGGSATHGNCTPCAEFNIWVDPEAAQLVFRSPAKKVLFPLEVTEQAYVTREEIDAFGAKDSPISRFFRAATPDLLRKNMEAGQGGWCIHDACPVLYCAHPELFSGEEAGVYVETQSELTRGKTVTDLFSDKQFERKNCLVLLEVNRLEFVKHITAAVLNG